MTGLPEFNRPAMNRAARLLREAGFDVFNPAELGMDDWKAGMRQCVKALPDCDTLVQMTGWQSSRGAKVEHELAVMLGLEVTDFHILERHILTLSNHGLPLPKVSV